jgi:hypothetical protein
MLIPGFVMFILVSSPIYAVGEGIECHQVIDDQGHGPDPGSVEWWQSCYHQLLVGTWLKPIEGMEGYEGFRIFGDHRMEFVNIFSMTGDKWDLNEEMNLNLWSHTERYPDSIADEYEIISVTATNLVLRKSNGMKLMVYTRSDQDE